eukprot:592030-Alexandrium_andersonii.AAC.1
MGHIYSTVRRIRYPETPAQADARRKAQGSASREVQAILNGQLRGVGVDGASVLPSPPPQLIGDLCA